MCSIQRSAPAGSAAMISSAPNLAADVVEDGYHWWYLDAVSDDGVHALTVIVFVGSVFSPYYAWARQQRPTPAAQHCAFNVALYGPKGCWAMTERTGASLERNKTCFALGPSQLRAVVNRDQKTDTSKKNQSQHQLIYDINEVGVPLPRRIQGQLLVDLPNAPMPASTLDSEQLHWWQPLAPCTRISVAMRRPALNWQGTAYVDSNWGAIPLERSFRYWDWSRAHPGDNTTHLHYDVVDVTGNRHTYSRIVDAVGNQTPCATRCQTLPKTRWFRMPRRAMTHEVSCIKNLQTLEDTPFYSRNRFCATQSNGQTMDVIHESLDLQRFDSPITRCLLPFRMPRRR